MAAFELNIYGENDSILKTYTTDKVRWGIFLKAFEIEERIAGASKAEQLKVINELMRELFPSLHEEDLRNADINDVFNIFVQLLKRANKIGGGKLKNASGAE